MYHPTGQCFLSFSAKRPFDWSGCGLWRTELFSTLKLVVVATSHWIPTVAVMNIDKPLDAALLDDLVLLTGPAGLLRDYQPHPMLEGKKHPVMLARLSSAAEDLGAELFDASFPQRLAPAGPLAAARWHMAADAVNMYALVEQVLISPPNKPLHVTVNFDALALEDPAVTRAWCAVLDHVQRVCAGSIMWGVEVCETISLAGASDPRLHQLEVLSRSAFISFDDVDLKSDAHLNNLILTHQAGVPVDELKFASYPLHDAQEDLACEILSWYPHALVTVEAQQDPKCRAAWSSLMARLGRSWAVQDWDRDTNRRRSWSDYVAGNSPT